ncbi:hypothetical protein PI124_g17282 [Phytophthora idaei]|nr:hypothetical protein PI125_g18427 [Phytophthora idaei]KAG3140782.1 hypothetical protein PI126_g15829 [Phytophthora idaei]KAG3237741.1 hypothetical protein PI124_g17282 [Phytophthora idaei]
MNTRLKCLYGATVPLARSQPRGDAEFDGWEPHVNLLHGVPAVILKYEFSVSSGNEVVGRPADTTNETVDASNDDATVVRQQIFSQLLTAPARTLTQLVSAMMKTRNIEPVTTTLAARHTVVTSITTATL